MIFTLNHVKHKNHWNIKEAAFNKYNPNFSIECKLRIVYFFMFFCLLKPSQPPYFLTFIFMLLYNT